MRHNVTLFFRKGKLRLFFFILLLLFFACDNPAADPDDFKDQDLSGKDFSGLSIYGYDLSGKNLQNASFQFSDVSGTNFLGADLRGASFKSATLYGADFTNADMRGVNLDEACFFQKATWTGTLLDPKWEKLVKLFEDGQLTTTNLQGYDFSSVCFDEIYWKDADFSNATLKGALFNPGARDLSNTIFQNANLESAYLAIADLTNVDFTDAILDKTDLSNATLSGANISQEQLSQAILGGCTRFPDGTLFNLADCYVLSPTYTDLSDFSSHELDLSGKNFQNANFQDADLSWTNFTDADLRDANFEGATFFHTNFTNADMRGAILDEACRLEAAIWTGAILDPKWEKVIKLFQNGRLIQRNLQGYDLSFVCFEDEIFEGVDFSDANLESAIFTFGANKLANSIFRNANLHSAQLVGADLTNADFTNAVLTKTDLSGATLTGAKITQEQLSSARISVCTRMPDGTLYKATRCYNIAPNP